MHQDQSQKQEAAGDHEIATFGGGCFWCLEAVFEDMKGVTSVISGYSGGTVKNPSYGQVCSGTTGHAETVQIEFDPRVVSFEDLLDVFFTVHDPTSLNRQGADVGSQYRSVIFYQDQRQKQAAEKKIKELDASRKWDRPIVTDIVPFAIFYTAEEYHQDYFKQHPEAGYCQAVVAPKVQKFHDVFPDKAKK